MNRIGYWLQSTNRLLSLQSIASKVLDGLEIDRKMETNMGQDGTKSRDGRKSLHSGSTTCVKVIRSVQYVLYVADSESDVQSFVMAELKLKMSTDPPK